MSNPLAVIISDVHYSLQTLEVADKCLRQAIEKANDLEVPLIISGDLHDTKANMRGECIKAMLDTIDLCERKPYILVGNHDKTNEKSESHSLEFLRKVAYIVDEPSTAYNPFAAYMIPYQHDVEEMRKILAQIPDGSRLIIHQGRHGALPGSYSHDKTALSEADYAPFTVISGHYHQHQKFHNQTHDTTFTYVGNPYTLDFSEANHPAKGFLILNEDFTFERVLTNVRKHVVIHASFAGGRIGYSAPQPIILDSDIVLLKVEGSRTQLGSITKDAYAQAFKIPGNFRLDLIPTDSEVLTPKVSNESAETIYTGLVEETKDLSEADKEALKQFWKDYAS